MSMQDDAKALAESLAKKHQALPGATQAYWKQILKMAELYYSEAFAAAAAPRPPVVEVVVEKEPEAPKPKAKKKKKK